MSELILPPVKPGMNAIGKIETIVYFQDRHKHLIIAAHDKQPTPLGYERCEATTLGEAQSLSQRMAEQQMRKFAAMDRSDMEKRERFFGACIARAKKTIANPLTRQSERDYLIRKLVPSWEAQIKEGRAFREFFFHQEAYEATNKNED